jgi:hypothetical protein
VGRLGGLAAAVGQRGLNTEQLLILARLQNVPLVLSIEAVEHFHAFVTKVRRPIRQVAALLVVVDKTASRVHV